MKVEQKAQPTPLPGVLAHATPEELADLKDRARAWETKACPATAEALHDALWGLTRACTEREAQALLPAVAAVSASHTAIGGAELLLGMLVGHGQGLMVDMSNWATFTIPGTQGIAALKDKGSLSQPAFNLRVLAGSEEPAVIHRGCAKSAEEVREAVSKFCGFDVVAVLRKQRGGAHG
jgi:hypothetical protein